MESRLIEEEEIKNMDAIQHFMIKNIISIDGDLPITKAAGLMIKYNIGSVLVELRDRKNKFSVITKTDIVKMLKDGLDPGLVRIKDVVGNKKLITCKSSTTLEEAMLLMAKNKIERLFVTDEKDGKIIGIISSSDILKITPGLLEIKREYYYINDASPDLPETFSGYCDSCGNYSENLQDVGGFALCKECREAREESREEEPTIDEDTM